MSKPNPFVLPGAPAELVARINARRSRIPVGMTMSASETRPEGVSEEEWGALGDPGKRALVREREARERAERDLTAARSAERLGQKPETASVEPVDINAVIEQAVAAAIQPFQQAEEQRARREASEALDAEVRKAAKDRLHDEGDALAHIDLATLAGEDGQPDAAKITAALDELVKSKPYLAKATDQRRQYDPGNPVGGGQQAASDSDRVQVALGRMKAATGIKIAEPTT